jgi:hypothetical protein
VVNIQLFIFSIFENLHNGTRRMRTKLRPDGALVTPCSPVYILSEVFLEDTAMGPD